MALVGALAGPILPALAQEGGLVLTFGINERVEYRTNPNLKKGNSDSRTRADTQLSFGLSSVTAIEKLRLDVSGVLRLSQSSAGGTSDNGFQDPALRFSYARDTGNAALSAAARFRETQVDFLRPLDEFLNPDGVLELPEDFRRLRGSGTRRDYGANLGLELGKEAPLGLILNAGLSRIAYSNVAVGGNLNNITRENAGATVRLNFSDVTRGRVALTYDHYTEDNVEQTDRQTTAARLGLTQDLSPDASIDATFGYSRVETTEFGRLRTTTGPVFSLGYGRTLPNGRLSVDYDARQQSDGTWQSISLGRTLTRPDGALTARIGVVDPSATALRLTGELAWDRTLPDGRVNARLVRNVTNSTNNGAILATVLSLGYNRDLTAVSGIGLRMSLARIEETDQNTVTRTDVTATYRHALTQDWDVNAGVNWAQRDEQAAGKASSRSVFVGIGRTFSVRP